MNYFFQALADAFSLIVSLDSEVYIIVWTSLKISLVAVFAASLVGIPLGLYTALREFPGKSFVLQMLNTLMALPTVVVGLVLYGVFTRQGPLGGMGMLYTAEVIIVGQCILIIPIIWNLSITAAKAADPRLADTCKALGANTLQQGWIFVGEVRYALMAAMIIGFGRAIGEVGVAMMLGGNIEGFTRTMTTAIALQTSKGEFEFGLALGVLLMTVAFVVNAILQWFQSLNQ